MKKFLKLLLIFGILFFVLEKVFYIFIFVAPSLEVDNRLENVINGELNKDLIILGSSRGARNIIASQIGDSLHISSYNLSYPGSDIEFHEFLLKSLLKFNHPPKTVLLVVDEPAELLPSKAIKFRLDRLYPLSKYSYINDELIRRGEKSILSNVFALARINKNNFDIRKRRFTKLDSIFEDGSMPVSFQKKDADFVYPDNYKYNSADELDYKLEAFAKFQELCISNNIDLHIVFPPNFYPLIPAFETRLKNLSNPEVSFYTYDSLNYVYKNTEYFYDVGHLQKNGAVVFTNEIIDYLKIKATN